VPLLESLADSSHRAAFFNSLFLATSVGLLGTALGFLFDALVFAAAYRGLAGHWPWQ
jgi:iron(III) transport system permease protein